MAGVLLTVTPRGMACEIDNSLDSAASEGIVEAEEADANNSATKSMSCKLLVPGPHLNVTPKGTRTAEEVQRANEIIVTARQALDKYKDYHVAERDGYKVHLAKIPQKHYHFTNWRNASLNIKSFDPTRPTSLLYEKDSSGNYQLEGVMYTAPKSATLADLNERFPVSVAPWHLHTNLCLPPKAQWKEMFQKHAQFGLNGSITTAEACEAAGGTFRPVVYNWMTHVDLYGSDEQN